MEFKIINSKWKVLFVDAYDSKLCDGDRWLIGRCNPMINEIAIANNLSRDITRATVMHEVTHVAIITLMDNKNEFDQEAVCRFMEAYADFITEITNSVLGEHYGHQ